MIKVREKKRGKPMSLKKRMFRSNMMILFAALCSLMLIILGVLILFEDSLERQLHSITQSQVDPNAWQVSQLIEETDPEAAEEFVKHAENLGYQTALFQNGRVVGGYDGEHMKDLAEVFQSNEYQSGQTEVFTFQKATIIGKYFTDENIYLAAVHFPEEDGSIVSLNASFYIFVGAVFLAGIAAIAVLLFLASFFTRRMNRVVMEPLEQLVEGAERIKSGNLKENIKYQGEAEFEHVCETFNEMQHTILEDQRQREKTEKARTDMITGISHDLRTPLTSIRGYIKGVLDGLADTGERKKRYLETAYESTEEMNHLLQKLFDFSRMESGQMPFHMIKADLAEYAASYVAQKEVTADPRKLKFHFHKKEELIAEVRFDIEQIRRILDNLLENSMKYAMVEPVEIDITVSETESEIKLEWKDNGNGVPEEKLGRIFERFYRCDESRQKKGSGVGLYVTDYIMKQHGGSAKAENDGGLKIILAFPKGENDMTAGE